MIEASQATTPVALQEFYNSDLGEPFVPPNGGLRLDELDRCRGNYALEEYSGQPCVMGVDVGIVLHIVIRESPRPQRFPSPLVPPPAPPRLWFAGAAAFDALHDLIERFNVESCVIDQQPERHKAAEFASRARVGVWQVNYGGQELGFEVKPDRVIRCHRVDMMDQVVDRFRKGETPLPRDARQLGGRIHDGYGEYYHEVMAPQRTLEHDRNGNLVSRWDERHRDDHYFHAEVYALLAEKVRNHFRIEPAW
jgi:hypothetical protein